MEKPIFSAGIKHCTKKDFIEALKDVNDDDLILISDGSDFFTIEQMVHDKDSDVVVRMSKDPY